MSMILVGIILLMASGIEALLWSKLLLSRQRLSGK